jgi:GTP-binding protein YchF
MKLGIIGKPQSGKTTIFNAAGAQHQAVGDFSQAVHRAIIKVPDARLEALAELVHPKKITQAEIELLDAPGLSGKGKEAAGLEISQDLRQMDAFLLVVDAFSPDAKPEADIRNVIDELVFLDQVLIESNIDKRERKTRLTGDKHEAHEIDLLKRCLKSVEDGKPLIESNLTEDELRSLKGYMLLSLKPLLIVLNIAEEQLPKAAEIEAKYHHLVQAGKRELAVVCGKIEMDLVTLSNDERGAFLADLGIAKSAMDVVVQRSYALLGLISFLTAGEPEVRAWTIRKGTNAQKSAGVIHSDIERGFIRAEVTRYDDYVALKTPAAIKAAGKQRLEGKEYVIDDGDVILFRFNV